MLQPALSVLIVGTDPGHLAVLQEGLREAGHGHLTVLQEYTALAERIAKLQPDVIVIEMESPDRETLEPFFQVTRAVGRPVIMFVGRSDTATIGAAADAGVAAYIVDGLKKDRVKPILDMAVGRFRAVSRLHDELASARSALEERKLIERAKGILMQARQLSEEEAYRLLRQTAMNEKKKLADIARSVITAAGMLLR